MGDTIDLTGQKFGALTVKERVGTSAFGEATWNCVCDCGNAVERTSRQLRRTQFPSCGCRTFMDRERENYFIGRRFGRWTVLRAAPKRGKRVYFVCQCDCGTIKEVRIDGLTGGDNQSCGCLQKEHRLEKRELQREDLTGHQFGRWTVLNKYGYRRHLMHWLCRCECGTIRPVSESNLRNGTSTSCGCYSRDIHSGPHLDRSTDLTGQTFGKLTVLYRTDQKAGCNYKWMCRCECGNEKSVAGYNLTHGITKSCGSCCFVSTGEWAICSLLDANNINYVHDKTFDTCVNPDTGKRYRFDFFVDNRYIVEYDGEQHFFRAGDTWEKSRPLEKRQADDMAKNKWCIENNIPLIRVPYNFLENLSFEDIVPETAQFLICGEISGWAYLLSEDKYPPKKSIWNRK